MSTWKEFYLLVKGTRGSKYPNGRFYLLKKATRAVQCPHGKRGSAKLKAFLSVSARYWGQYNIQMEEAVSTSERCWGRAITKKIPMEGVL